MKPFFNKSFEKFLIPALLGVGLFLLDGASWASEPHTHLSDSSSHSHSGGKSLDTYGPGRSPHIHGDFPDHLFRVKSVAHSAKVRAQEAGLENAEVDIQLEAREMVSQLADGVEYSFWTFGGTVPGPLLRARVGQNVRLTLKNHATSTHSHSIDLHALTGPGGGAAKTQVRPGESRVLEFRPTHPGVYVYHCGTPNVPSHIANGMYGLMVVDPEEGWPRADREFYIMQGEFYTKGSLAEKGFQKFSPDKLLSERPEYIVWNGKVRSLAGKGILKVGQGERVRLFVGNAGVSRSLNFHVIGEILDRVYVEGGMQTRKGIQTTLIPAGGAAAVEMVMETPGIYTLVDHALSRIERGAWGQIEVQEGKAPDPEKGSQLLRKDSDGHLKVDD